MNVHNREKQRTVRIYFTRKLRTENPIVDKDIFLLCIYLINQENQIRKKNALKSKCSDQKQNGFHY